MDEKTLPIRLVKSLLLSAKKKGGDIEKLLDGLDISFNPIDPTKVDARIPVRLYCKLLRRVAMHSHRHLFGLPVNETEPAMGLRLMCMALLSCGSIEKAIECTADFYRHYGHPGWRFTVAHCGDDVVLNFTGRDREDMYAYDISFLLRLWSWLSGQFIETTEVRLMESQKQESDTYAMLFDCEVQYCQSENTVRFDAGHLHRPIVQTEESLTKLLEEAPYELLVMSRNSLKSIMAKIRFIVGSDFSKGFPSREKISEILHISSSSLQRRLAEEGTSYQMIKDEIRKNAAIRYLHRPELSVAATASLMGFDDSCAFNRTFKRWTGMPPGLYRKHYLTPMRSA
ncbi:MAG: AraC family transcriptional regulator ligand-binding domain-containing protein [Halioglobus sp.]|nr:AraC family transcriptional regulator ligand-binding domain-containing protein [Halioglobus sp.]